MIDLLTRDWQNSELASPEIHTVIYMYRAYRHFVRYGAVSGHISKPYMNLCVFDKNVVNYLIYLNYTDVEVVNY